MSPLVLRSLPPLVVYIGRRQYAWIENGRGFVLDTRGLARWQPLTDAILGGHVLQADAVAQLVATHGRPTS